MNLQYQIAMLGITGGSPYAALSFGLAEPDEIVSIVNGGSPFYSEVKQKARLGHDWISVEDEELIELIQIMLPILSS